MGGSVACRCEACGYDAKMLTGAGRANYLTSATWPVICAKCVALTPAEYAADPLTCSECGSTDVSRISAPENWLGDGDLTVQQCSRPLPKQEPSEVRKRAPRWAVLRAFARLLPKPVPAPPVRANLRITDGHYRCPACGNFSLRFPSAEQNWILWD